jgi:hypothetical protein
MNINECLFESRSDFYERVRSGYDKLWFFCSIVFLDFMQNRHEIGFCWQRHEGFGGGQFRMDATPAYNSKT